LPVIDGERNRRRRMKRIGSPSDRSSTGIRAASVASPIQAVVGGRHSLETSRQLLVPVSA
jgi:hypothetical protein